MRHSQNVVDLRPKRAESLETRRLIPADKWDRIAAIHEPGVRYDMSIEDLRDLVIGIVHETFGRGDDAYIKVEERLGAHRSTLKAWAEKRIKSPQASKLRSVLRACNRTIPFG